MYRHRRHCSTSQTPGTGEEWTCSSSAYAQRGQTVLVGSGISDLLVGKSGSWRSAAGGERLQPGEPLGRLGQIAHLVAVVAAAVGRDGRRGVDDELVDDARGPRLGREFD